MIYPTPIPGYPDYGATPDGRIFSRKRGAWRELKLHPKGKGGDYLKIKLYTSPGFYDQIAVHTLIALTFIGPKPVAPAATIVEVNHKDLRKRNNKVGNLEWLTRRENIEHALKARGFAGLKCATDHLAEMIGGIRRGLSIEGAARRRAMSHRLAGVEMSNRRLSESAVREIRLSWRPSLNGEGGTHQTTRAGSLAALAAEYGVSKNTIWRIVRGMKWRHVSPAPWSPHKGSKRRASRVRCAR